MKNLLIDFDEFIKINLHWDQFNKIFTQNDQFPI